MTAAPNVPTAPSRVIPAGTSRAQVALICLVTACCCMVVSAWLHSHNTPDMIGAGILVMLAGGLALGFTLQLAPVRANTATAPEVQRAAVRIRPLLAGTTALALLTFINANWVQFAFLEGVYTHFQVALFGGGVVLVGWGLSGVARPHLPHVARREALVLAGILAFALVVRVWQLEDSIRALVDEPHMVEAVVNLRAQPNTLMLMPFHWAAIFPWFYPYAQTWTTAIFGSNMAAMRLVGAIVGTLTVLAVYIAGRSLVNRRVGVIAALLLAAFPPHIHFSRLALINVADPLFGTLAFAMMAHALRSGRRSSYALAGVMLGLTQYFYEGGRLLFPGVMAAWLALLIVYRYTSRSGRNMGLRISARGLATTATAALLATAPFYLSWMARGLELTPKLNFQSGLFPRPQNVSEYLHHYLRMPLGMFVNQPDNSQFYGGETPMLLLYVAPFFLLGLFALATHVILARGRSEASHASSTYMPLALLALPWLGATIVGMSMLYNNGWVVRAVGVLPAVCLVTAVGIAQPLALLAQHAPRRPMMMAGAALVGALVLGQVAYYFGPHLAFFNLQVRTRMFVPHNDYYDVYYRARDLPRDMHVVLVTDEEDPDRDSIALLSAFQNTGVEIEFRTPEGVAPDWLLATYERGKDLAVFIAPEDLGSYRRISEWFPLGGPQFSPYNVPRSAQFALFVAEHPGALPEASIP